MNWTRNILALAMLPYEKSPKKSPYEISPNEKSPTVG